MTNEDKEAFSVAIGAMCETFGVQATKPILRGYWLGLVDLSIEDVRLAVAVSLRSSTSLPKPVDLRRYVGEQTAEQRAIDAWGDALKAVAHGPYRHVDFGDRMINATIRSLGGWPSFCERFSGSDAEKWLRLDFVKTYQALAGRNVDGEACAPLPGLSQAEAVAGCMAAPAPRRIPCDPSRAGEPRRISGDARGPAQQLLTVRTV